MTTKTELTHLNANICPQPIANQIFTGIYHGYLIASKRLWGTPPGGGGDTRIMKPSYMEPRQLAARRIIPMARTLRWLIVVALLLGPAAGLRAETVQGLP